MSDRANDTLFLFPGQGSQYPGIGSDLYDAEPAVREVYQTASEVLGYDMARLSFHDPDGNIHLTRHTQPVLLTHSFACIEALESRLGRTLEPATAAGHSLGEYGALIVAGSLDFPEALKLVRARGELMGEHGEGEMEALPVSLDEARGLADAHYCAIAACNMPEQTVVGGRSDDLDRLSAAFAEANPRKRSARLKTEGAFHTYYMIRAAQAYRRHLADAPIAAPRTPVFSNYTGRVHDADPDSIRTGLFFQLFHPVLWHQNLVAAVERGARRIIEFGGGLGKDEGPASKRPNLEGIVKKTFRRAENPPQYSAVINCATLDAVAAELA